MVHPAPEGQVWIPGPSAACVCVDVFVLCCNQKPCGCPWFVLPPEAMLMSVGRDVTEGHIYWSDLCWYLSPWFCLGPYCCWGPHLGPRFYCSWRLCSQSVLSPEIVWKPMIHAHTNDEDQRVYFCCDINDCRCSWEAGALGGFWNNSYPYTNPSKVKA